MGWGTLPARMRSSLRGQYGQRVHPDAVVHHRVSGQITVLKLPVRILFVRHGSDQVVARALLEIRGVPCTASSPRTVARNQVDSSEHECLAPTTAHVARGVTLLK